MNKDDKFFSYHQPVTVVEDLQTKYGFSRALRPKDMAVEKYLKKVNYKKAKKILDFGCANGVWLERILKETRAKGVGVDVSHELIKIANERKEKKGKYFVSGQKWPIKKQSIDLIYSLDVWEHVEDKDREMNRLYQSLKTGGKMLIFTLNPNNKYTFDWWFEKLGSDWLNKRADHKKKNYEGPEELVNRLNKIGLKKVDYRLYGAPGSLFWDVASYLYLMVMEKILGQGRLMKIVLWFNHNWMGQIRWINWLIDFRFLRKGYSNGYFIWAEK